MTNISITKSCLVICLLLASSFSFAAPIDFKTAKNKAEKFYNTKFAKESTNPLTAKDKVHIALHLMCESVPDTRSASYAPEYYVFAPADSIGFVIVAGDDEVEPIVGYSSNTRFNVKNLPESLEKYLRSYRTYINRVRSGEQTPRIRTRAKIRPVKPFITTTWNQNHPYNYYAPSIGNRKTLAGCFAIAISQIMRYYEWPLAGKGTCTATLNDRNNTETTITLGKEYDWANMLDSYSNQSYTNIEMTAASALIRDAGYACSSCYGTNETWAYNIDAFKALLRHFCYSPQIRMVDRMYYSDETWNEMLQEELSWRRPIWFCGQDENGNGGHSFICCGMDELGLYYINWGWGGYCDGYFDMNAFSPDNHEYNVDQQAIINILPMDGEESEDDFDITPHVGNLQIISQDNSLLHPSFECSIYVTNTSDQIIYGKVGFSIWGEEGIDPSETTEVNYYGGIEPNWWWQYNLGINLDGEDFQTPGVKEIRFLWQPEGSDQWHTPLGENNVIYMETTDSGHYFYTERPQGVPDHIKDIIARDISIKVDGNCIRLVSNKHSTVNIYYINGMIAKRVTLTPNSMISVPLEKGMYTVNGRKIIIN